MATTKDLIKQALRNIGVLSSGEEPDPDDLNDSLLIAQQMIEGWSNERLLVPAVTHETFAVNTVGAKAVYTFGTGGDLNSARPLAIVDIQIKDASGSTEPVTLTSLAQWKSITPQNMVSRPSYAYFEPSYPLAKLYFTSITEADTSLVIVSHKELTALPALNSDTAYPPGYDRCIRLNLEVELASAFERPVNGMTVKLANAAKKTLKRINSTPMTSRVDSAWLSDHSYDISTGP